MNKSPFDFGANAVLNFDIASDSVEVNDFGNTISIKKSLTITAYLKAKKKKYDNREGADTTDIELEGYLINPLEYPKEIKDGMKAKAEIQLYANEISKGDFLIRKKPENFFVLSANIKGITKIQGNFRI